MRIPLTLKIAAVALSATGFYTYIGQMVPQKEVQPPKEVKLKADMSTADMVKTGKEIAEGKGLCLTCHTIGKKAGPFRYPDLEGIGGRAASRVPGFSDVDYFAQTLYEPDVFIVPGFTKGMPTINKPPIGLTDQEILCVISFLQSMGGTPSVTMATKVAYTGGGKGPAAAGGASAEAAATATAPGGAAPSEAGKPSEAAAAAGGAAAPAATASATGAGTGKDLMASYGCVGCHQVDGPDELKGPSLYDIGKRHDQAAIFTAIMYHDAHPSGKYNKELTKDALTSTGFYQKATLEQVNTMVAWLAQKKGEK